MKGIKEPKGHLETKRDPCVRTKELQSNHGWCGSVGASPCTWKGFVFYSQLGCMQEVPCE